MSGESGGFRFVSHQRTGLIAVPAVAAAGTIDVAAVFADGTSTTAVTLTLPGPADVLGLDTTLVQRQYPRPGTTDAETEFFPLVEFSVPELAWLLPTPDGATGPIPWLCLVVVESRNGVSLKPGGLGTPDLLQIGDPAKPGDELPDPANAALWAHAFAATTVQTTGGGDPVEEAPGPPVGGCRLIAPRRLLPDTSYIACLVPTLAATALSGLGHDESDVSAALAAPQPNWAWSLSDASVELPVYLSWEFSCSAIGDFESLARSLHEVPVDDSFGTRPLDLGLAGAGMPVTGGTTTVLRGALTAPGVANEPAWPAPGDADQGAVDDALTKDITIAAALTASAGPSGRPAVGPLLYARAAAGRGSVAPDKPAADWFDQLNRDPRARSVAGIATRVLRRNVEDVMAAAWEQVGDVEAANAVLRRLQLSRAVSASIHTRHLTALSSGRLASVARPLLARLALPPAASGGIAQPNALAAVAASALPAGSTWRGVGIGLRRAGSPTAAAEEIDVPGRVLSGLLTGIAEPDVLPDGTVAVAPPSAVLGAAAATLLDARLQAAAAAADLAAPPAGADATTTAKGLDSLAAAAGGASLASATKLAGLTAVDVAHHQLPGTATFASTVGGPGRQVALGATAAHAVSPAVEASTGHAAAPTHAPVTTAGSAAGTVTAASGSIVLAATDPRLAAMRDAFAGAVGRFVRAGTSTALPAAAGLDLDAARSGLLASVDPALTFVTLAAARVPGIAGLTRLDPVAPVMAGPVFPDAAFPPLVQASHDAFVPGLDAVPADSVTLVQTNPTFIAAYLAGLNSALGQELLWRGYPTDERGTYWHSFWGAGPEIGALNLFTGSLPSNVSAGAQPPLVLVLRGRLLRRYPDSDIYAILGSADANLPELDDGTKIVRPLFRDFVDPDFTLVGFALTYDAVVGTGGGEGYWFVIAEHPGQPRFGLTDPDPAVTHPPLPSWNELSWADLGPAGATATYVPAAAPPMTPAGTSRAWGASAANMAAITYQPAVRVALRARDLLKAAAS